MAKALTFNQIGVNGVRFLHIESFAKRFLLRKLPRKIMEGIRKVYYASVLKSFSEDKAIDLKIIAKLVDRGDCVVDIGANIGVYTKYLAEYVGASGLVYSIEPFPLTFEILRYNVKKLGLRNVYLINCAISDSVGIATMEVPLKGSGVEDYYGARIVENENRKLNRAIVKTETMDSLFSHLPHNISFIKCDVEGYEFQCIKGAINIIRDLKPALHIEISQDTDNLKSNAYRIFTLLDEMGYCSYAFDGKNLERHCSEDKNVNYFFLQRRHLERLQREGFISETSKNISR